MCVKSSAHGDEPFPMGTRFAREAQAANTAHLLLSNA